MGEYDQKNKNEIINIIKIRPWWPSGLYFLEYFDDVNEWRAYYEIKEKQLLVWKGISPSGMRLASDCWSSLYIY